MKTERTCLYVVNGLLCIALVLLAECSKGQSMPSYLSRDPEYWYNQYQAEHIRAEALEKSGATAIRGLEASLKVANDTIVNQGVRIERMKERLTTETQGRQKAEASVKTLESERDRVRGKTWAGRQLRLFRDQLAVVGAVALGYLTVRVVL